MFWFTSRLRSPSDMYSRSIISRSRSTWPSVSSFIRGGDTGSNWALTKYIPRQFGADAVDPTQGHVSLLSIGHVHSGNSNHFSASSNGPGDVLSLTLALGMPGIHADDAHHTFPLDHAAPVTSRLNRRSNFHSSDLPGLFKRPGLFETIGNAATAQVIGG